MSSSTDSERSVVITGLGIVSPLGIGVEPFWSHLAEGRSGIAPVDMLAATALPKNVAGEVKDFTDETAKKQYLKPARKWIKVMCREIQLGVASALLAFDQSGLDINAIDHERFGVDFGANLMFSPPDVLQDPCWECVDSDDPSHKFHYEQWGRDGANTDKASGMAKMEPLWLLKYLPNMPACHICITLDARGPSNSLTMEEASGNLSLGEAFRIVQRGAADIMIAGVTGTRLHPVKSLHARMWDQMAVGDSSPETWCKPFDANRNGQVAAEGACSLILEEESAAKARGATIYGRILGIGSSCAAAKSGQPDIRLALANAMRSALNDAAMQPGDIGHINAHGLGSTESDRDEAAAIADVFGSRSSEIPVTALKSYFGNCGSGCGLLELAGSLLGLKNGVVPATLNYESPDPDCRLNIVHGQPLAVTNKSVLNINVTRMGQASAVIVKAD